MQFKRKAVIALPDDADSASRSRQLFDEAKAEVLERLRYFSEEDRHFVSSPQPLDASELQKYGKSKAAAGWKQSVKIGLATQDFNILLPPGFPWVLARIAAVPNKFLKWPHVEKNGILCVVPSSTEFDPNDPSSVVTSLLGDAIRLSWEAENGVNDDHFREEILSYWNQEISNGSVRVFNILRSLKTSRLIKICNYEKQCVIAESQSDLSEWMAKLHQKKPSYFHTEDALMIWLQTAPMPCEFPKTGCSLCELVKKSDDEGIRLFADLAVAYPKDLPIFFGMDTVYGAVYTGVVLHRKKRKKEITRKVIKRSRLNDASFIDDLKKGYLGNSKVSMRNVDRADQHWVHGRGRNPEVKRLQQKKVAIVGCGSMGGEVAVLLAKSGVGSFVLIDPDDLQWPNLSRHILGASSIMVNKAFSVANKLKADLPHISASHHGNDVDEYIRLQKNPFSDVDLIVSVTGNWAADSRVDAWRTEATSQAMVLYGWLEPRACAGHAVLIAGRSDSIRHGCNRVGKLDYMMTDWGDRDTLEQEAGCGGQFQPYGAIELSAATSLVSSVALDALLDSDVDSCHKVWVAPYEVLKRAGGKWSEEWCSDPMFRSEGGLIVERRWPKEIFKTKGSTTQR